jgi:alpha-tubulin suppressor-like RCC1 family protein
MDEFKNSTNSNLLKESLENIEVRLITNLIQNTNITKEELIFIAKNKKDEFPEEWIKLRKKFGTILNIVNKSIKYKDLWDQIYNNQESKLYYLCNLSNNIVLNFKNPIRTISTVSTEKKYTAILIDENNHIYVKGDNFYNQLLLTEKNIDDWKLVKNTKLANCRKVFLGWSHSIFLCEDKLYGAGCGADGRIGNNSLDDKCSLSEVILDDKIKKVECGSTNTYFLSEGGDIYSCGLKYYLGQNSDDKDLLIPKKIQIDSKYKFVDISVGDGGYHILALNENGEVYSWGHNRVGQTSIIQDYDFKEDLKVYWVRYPTKIKIDRPILKISTGWGHSGLLDFEGNVYLFGRNCTGQLGLSKSQSKINKVSKTYYNNEIIRLNFDRKIKDLYCGHVDTLFLTKNHLMENEFYRIGNLREEANFDKNFKLVNTFENIKGIKINDSYTILIEK